MTGPDAAPPDRRGPPPVAGIVLAAGASRRFGAEDKLLADLGGTPLAARAAAAMRAAPVDMRIAVAAAPEVARLFAGFEVVAPDPPGAQSDSLRAGIRRARALGAGRIVVTLADMPFVDANLIAAVLSRAETAAATDGDRRTPPAAFPAARFDDLLRLGGDRGAGALLRGLPPEALVTAPRGALADVDTPDALAALRAADP